MKFFGRMLAGGAAGGAIGAMDGGGLGGALGGAAAGAAVGGFGGMAARRLAGGRTFSGMTQRGLGLGMQGANRMRRGLMSNIGMSGQGAARSYLGDAMRSTGQGLFGARQFVGQNAIAVNKWGGRAAMGMGVASAASIGSSIMSSNSAF